ncbi:transporter substrate-binding domain-containing protein [Bordetella genomosp. 11]|uniref:transporter substrate-binding domain-containing protein n=1 Tax=Bordetella genomosp. 11 TaxID=1416808 RepID=UPI001596388E|nr:transporter substrate-binding domain-containing protein [Bordetella genomosp. 11]
MFTRRYATVAALVVLAALQGCSSFDSTQEAYNAAWKNQKAGLIKQVLAPSGSLRVAVYRGSPTSFVQPDPKQPPRGVGYQLGEAFAKQLGVPFDPKVYPNNAEALHAVAMGQADFTFTNATPGRTREMDFSPPVMDVEKSVLVLANSRLRILDDLNKTGVRIGVSAGSSSATELKSLYPRAVYVPVDTLAHAVEMLRANRIDGFATNNAILFEMSDKLPGSRLLPGHWGVEHFAIGVPFGRAAAQDWVTDFVKNALAHGEVQAAIRRANVRGIVQAP